ncbi:hypothetical protein K8I85_14770 [bacterium]|nr:hypothetical protein [bacterium]
MRVTTLSLSILLLLAGASGALAAGICIVPSPNALNASVDCDPVNPSLFPNAVVGYSLDGAPCQSDFCGITRGGDVLQYGWSISSSSTDPNVNTGALPQPIAELYLWLSCAEMDGVAAAEFSLETDDPGFVLLALAPEPGVLNAGSFADPLLAIVGCPVGPTLIGTIIMLNVGPVSIEGETWGGIKALYR